MAPTAAVATMCDCEEARGRCLWPRRAFRRAVITRRCGAEAAAAAAAAAAAMARWQVSLTLRHPCSCHSRQGTSRQPVGHHRTHAAAVFQSSSFHTPASNDKENLTL